MKHLAGWNDEMGWKIRTPNLPVILDGNSPGHSDGADRGSPERTIASQAHAQAASAIPLDTKHARGDSTSASDTQAMAYGRLE
ncbi:hypothetical protein [Pontibacter sp. G13]|uniref:hypothetical protein n=1 Tax=Pontibacter sp. G13 TaxID=3074898 RepID=UPI00288A9CA0|nr:hypothetical protein [Pontibacter sp. G13]WNJ18617.1 hypothetical protein RJD25_27490 [Pontibacter sp. G13]